MATETLALDIRSALSSIDQLDRRLAATTARFRTDLAHATGQLDVAVTATGADKATADIRELGVEVENTDAKQRAATATSAKHSDSLEKVGRSALVMGAGLSAAFGLATVATINFDRELSTVAAVTDATAEELDQLRTAAIDAGQATVFSASEAAQAEAELAKAGLTTAQILRGGLTGALNLAAAGQLDLATAATIAAQAIKIFNLTGEDTEHVADVLAAGANKSTASVASLGEGLGNVGGTAKLAGLSLEETVGVLAALDNNSVRGAEGGTALRSALLALFTPSKLQREEMEKLGISAFDAGGKFVGLAGLAGILQDKLKGLTQEQRNASLGIIFGTFGIQAATALYNEGAVGVQRYTDAVNDQGAAQRFASTQLDNLSGDLEQLRGSIETALIASGSKATGILRFLAQGATEGVNAFANLPGPVQAGGVAFVGFAGGSLLAIGALATLVGKVREINKSLEGLPPGLASGVRGFSRFIAVAGGIGAVVTGALALSEALGLVSHGLEINTDRIRGLTQAGMDRFARQVADASKATDGALRITDVFNKVLAETPERAQDFIGALRRQGVETDGLQKKLDAQVKATQRSGEAQQQYADTVSGGTGVVADFAEEQAKVTDAFKDSDAAASDFSSVLDHIFGIYISAEKAQLGFLDSLVKLTDSLKENGNTLDLNTEKGRANRDALIDATEKAIAHAEAVQRETGSIDAAKGVLATHIDQLVQTAVKAGLSERAALDYTAALFGIPEARRTEIQNTADLARLAAEGLEATYNRLDGRTVNSQVVIDFAVNPNPELSAVLGEGLENRRRGGQVWPAARGRQTFRDGSFLVGEQGFELFRPTTPGVIIPHGQTAGLVGQDTPRPVDRSITNHWTIITSDPEQAGAAAFRRMRAEAAFS